MSPQVTGTPTRPPRAEIVVDLDALRHNVRRLRGLMADPGPALEVMPEVMVVVKADGYGHGMLPVASAARQAGAGWLGVATLDEARRLRQGGDEGRLLCWLAVPGEHYDDAIEHDVDLTASSGAQLAEIAAAGARVGRTARVQLKVDTGLSRNGAPRDQWRALVEAARLAEDSRRVVVTGLWSHFACSDEPDHPANDAQQRAFEQACEVAGAAGLRPEVRHLANSAAALLRPGSRYDLVRLGIASYGLTPAPDVVSSAELGLRPAMTVRASLALVKDIAAGEGVSYGHTFVADRPMTVGLVPVGYGDGIPRHASNTAEVAVLGRRCGVLGQVCMDQFVVDLTGVDAVVGDEVLLLGPGDRGEPLAQDWARACGTISYEIVTRVGGRMTRTWRDTGTDPRSGEGAG